MSFKYENFKNIGLDHSGSPAVYSYITTDSVALVSSAGYFADPRARIFAGDVIMAYCNGRPYTMVATSTSSARVDDPEGLIIVDSPDKLPAPVNGVHTLVDDYAYMITKTIDLEGYRVVGGRNSVLMGTSAETGVLKSTGLSGSALVTSQWSIPMRHIKLDAETILDLDANGNANQALDWGWINFQNSSDIGRIANYDNLICHTLGFLGATGLVIDGTIGTVGFTDTLFSGDGSGTSLTLPATANITRRIRFKTCAIVAFGSGTGFNVSTSATIPNDGYIIDKCAFSGGATYTAGVTFSDNRSRWSGNTGVNNSATVSSYSMTGNATATVIGGTGTPVKVSGVTAQGGVSQRFSHSNQNRETYDGVVEKTFKVSVTMSLSSGSGNEVGVYIAKNGAVIDESETYLTANAAGRLENGSCNALVELSNSDYIEIFVENNTAANDITVEDLNVIITTGD